MSNEV